MDSSKGRLEIHVFVSALCTVFLLYVFLSGSSVNQINVYCSTF